MKRHIATLLLAGGILVSSPLLARDINVEITNLTGGAYFTPLLVAAHDRETHLFEVGTEATVNLQAAAEGGNISGLIGDVEAAGGEYVANPAAGLLGPGETTDAELDIHGHSTSRLSIIGMLLPTNDGFVGLDAIKIPKKKGIYTYFLNGYDAGTEANDEIVNGGGAPGVPGIPADPGGYNGSGATGVFDAEQNARVHIHKGVVGDQDSLGGNSDLDSRVHRWLNPVARVVIRVGKYRDDD